MRRSHVTAKDLARIRKTIARMLVVSVVLYALLGGLLVFQAHQAFGQETLSSVYPTRGKVLDMKVPTGSDDKSVQSFYDYLTLRHVGTLEETYGFNWYYFNTMYLVIGTGLIVFYFLTFSWYAHVRKQGDLYPVEVYNAYITERGGPVDPFNWAVYTILLTYMAYYTVINLTLGQYY